MVGIVTAGITAYYMFRLFFVTFFGTYRGDLDPAQLGVTSPSAPAAHEPAHGETHAPAWLMAAPVAILGVFSVIAGYVMIGANSPWNRLFALTFHAENLPAPALSEGWTTAILFVVMAAGIAIAYLRYATPVALADAPARLRAESQRLPAPLVKLFYFDEVIDWVLVKPSLALGRFFGSIFDPDVIDGAVRGLVRFNTGLGALVRGAQTGLLRSYALVIVFGAALFAVYYALQGAAH